MPGSPRTPEQESALRKLGAAMDDLEEALQIVHQEGIDPEVYVMRREGSPPTVEGHTREGPKGGADIWLETLDRFREGRTNA